MDRHAAFCMSSHLPGKWEPSSMQLEMVLFVSTMVFHRCWYILRGLTCLVYIPLYILCIESLGGGGGSFLLCYSNVTCIPGHVYVLVRICCRYFSV